MARLLGDYPFQVRLTGSKLHALWWPPAAPLEPGVLPAPKACPCLFVLLPVCVIAVIACLCNCRLGSLDAGAFKKVLSTIESGANLDEKVGPASAHILRLHHTAMPCHHASHCQVLTCSAITHHTAKF